MKNNLTLDLSDFETSLKMELTLTSNLRDFSGLAEEFLNGLEVCVKNCEEKGIKGKLNFSLIKEE